MKQERDTRGQKTPIPKGHVSINKLQHNGTEAHETTRHALMMMRVVLGRHGGQL